VLLLVIALVVVVLLDVVILIRGGVKLLPLGAVGNEVGGVTTIQRLNNRNVLDSNSNLIKSMTHHNQIKKLTTCLSVRVGQIL
jgi:hypothetical protein